MAFKLESIFSFKDQAAGPIRGLLGNLGNLDRRMGVSTRTSGLLGNATARAFGVSGRAAALATRAVGVYTSATERAKRAQEHLNTQMERSRKTASGLRAGMVGLATTGALVAGGVGLIGKGIIDQLGYIEQQRIGLTTLLKSKDQANVTMKGILKFADVTPFETQEVMEAVRRGLAVGFTRGQLGPLLNTLGDAASGLSLGGAGFNELITVFGQIKSAGKINTEDINQLTDRGIGAWQILAKGLGKTIPQVRKMVEKGAIDSISGIRLLMDGLNAQFKGGMLKQSTTVFGLASTLKSRLTTVFANLESGGTLKPVQKFMMNLANLTDFSKPPGSRIEQRLSTGINKIMRAIFDPLSSATDGKRGEQLINGWLDKLDRAATWMQTNWPRIKKGAQDFWAGFTGVFSGAKAQLAPVIGAVEKLFGWLNKITGRKGGNQINWAWVAGAAAGVILLGGALRTVNTLLLGMPGTLAKLAGKSTFSLLKGAGGLAGKGMGKLGNATTMRIPALLDIRTHPGGILAGLRQAVQTGLGRIAPIASRAGAFIVRLVTGAVRLVPQLLRIGMVAGRAFLAFLGPIGLAITAVTAVVGVAVWAYHRFAWFRNAVNAVWNGIRTAAVFAWTGLRIAVTAAAGFLVGYVTMRFNLLRAGMNLAWNAIRTGATSAWNALRNGANSAMNFLSSLPARARQFGANIMQGLANGIRNGISTAVGAISGAGSTILTRFKGILGIKSPSRVFAQQGGYLMEGLAVGITRTQGRPVSAAVQAARDVAGAASMTAPRPMTATGRLPGTGGHTINLTVNVAPGDLRGATTPEQTGRAIGRGIVSEITDVFEQLASQI